MKHNQMRQVVFPILAAFIWGTAFVAQDMCADSIGAFAFNASRYFIAVLALLVVIVISDKLKSPLRCIFDDGVLNISTKTAIGDAADVCPISGDGKGLEIGFNNKYLMDALKAAPADRVRLELTTGVSPCVILPTQGDENFLYMVLPVRLKAGD